MWDNDITSGSDFTPQALRKKKVEWDDYKSCASEKEAQEKKEADNQYRPPN